MFDLRGPAALKVVHVTVTGESKGVPKANRFLHSKLGLKRTEWRVGVECPVAPGGAGESILEEHSDDGHHGQTTIGDLSGKLLGLLCRVVGCQDLPAIVAGCASFVILEAARELTESKVGNDLQPAGSRHLGDGTKAVGDVLELQASGGAEITWQFACDLRCNVTHGGQHTDAAVFDLHRAATFKGGHVAVCGKTQGVPKANRFLHSKLGLKRTEWRVGVECPVAPGGACKSILEEHSDDGHHGQTTIGDLSGKLLGLLCRVVGRQDLPAIVAGSPGLVILEAARELTESKVGNDLQPAGSRHLGDGTQAIGDVLELQASGGAE